MYTKRIEVQENNLQSIFATIWGQCSFTMQSKLESMDEYDKMSGNCDCAWLLKAIKGVTNRCESTRYVFLSLDDARTNFYSYKQAIGQTLHEYLKKFG